MDEKRIIFFDWDGTLCTRKAAEFGNLKRTKLLTDKYTEKETVGMLHNNNNDHYSILQELLKENTGITDINIVRSFQGVIFGYFYNIYLKENKENSFLFDLDKFLELKEKHNFKFVITTSLWEGSIKGALENLGIEKLFDGVYGCPTDLSTNKSDNLKRAIENEEGTPFLMIGDRGEDVDAGIENNLKTIFCNYGHGDVNNATISIEEPEELINAIEKLL